MERFRNAMLSAPLRYCSPSARPRLAITSAGRRRLGLRRGRVDGGAVGGGLLLSPDRILRRRVARNWARESRGRGPAGPARRPRGSAQPKGEAAAERTSGHETTTQEGLPRPTPDRLPEACASDATASFYSRCLLTSSSHRWASARSSFLPLGAKVSRNLAAPAD